MMAELELLDHGAELAELMVPELELVDHASELVELMMPEPELVDHAWPIVDRNLRDSYTATPKLLLLPSR